MEITRRSAVALAGLILAGPAGGLEPPAAGRITAHAFGFAGATGGDHPLAAFAGRPVLVVNTATACAFAPQLAGLQQVWLRFKDRGFGLLGVPSNDFGRQEPLDGPALVEAARQQHGVTFPLTERTSVRGEGAHPFYRWAAAERPGETPRWNFHKYLVDADGRLAAAFNTAVEPNDPRLIRMIGEILAARR